MPTVYAGAAETTGAQSEVFVETVYIDRLQTNIRIHDLQTTHVAPSPTEPQLEFRESTDKDGHAFSAPYALTRRSALLIAAHNNPPDQIHILQVDSPIRPGVTLLPEGMMYLTAQATCLRTLDHFMPAVLRFHSPVPTERPQVFELAIFTRSAKSADKQLFALVRAVPHLRLPGAKVHLRSSDGSIRPVRWASTLHPSDPARFVIDERCGSGSIVVTLPTLESFTEGAVRVDVPYLELAFSLLVEEVYTQGMAETLLQRDRSEEVERCRAAHKTSIPLLLSTPDHARPLVCFHPSVIQAVCGVICDKEGYFYLPDPKVMHRASDTSHYTVRTNKHDAVLAWLQTHGINVRTHCAYA